MKKRVRAGILVLALCVGVLAGCGSSAGVKENSTESEKSTEKTVNKRTEKADLTGKSEFIKNAVPDTSKIDIFDRTVYERMAEAYISVVDEKRASNQTDKRIKSSLYDINDDNLPELVVTSYSDTDEIAGIYAFDGKDAVLLVEIPCGEHSGGGSASFRRPILLFEVDDFDALQYKIYEYDMEKNDVTVYKDGLTLTPIPDSYIRGYTSESCDYPAARIHAIGDSSFHTDLAMYNIRMALKWRGMFLEEPISTKGLPVLSDTRLVDVVKEYVPATKLEEAPVPFELQIPVPAVTVGIQDYPTRDEPVFSIKATTGRKEWREYFPHTQNLNEDQMHGTPGMRVYIEHDFDYPEEVENRSDTHLSETIKIYFEITNTYLEINMAYDIGYMFGLDRGVLEDFETYRDTLWDTIVAQASEATETAIQSENIVDATSDDTKKPADAEAVNYEEVFEQYHDVLQETSFDMEAWEAKYPLAMGYVEYCFYERSPVSLASPPLYTLYDIDGNGTDEMLVLLNYSGRYELSDVISIVNGKATNAICGGHRYKIYLQDDGLVVYKSGTAMYDSFSVYRIQKNGEMKCIYSYERSLNPSAPGETVYTDDKSLSEQRKKELTLIAWDDSPVPAALNPETSSVWKNLQ